MAGHWLRVRLGLFRPHPGPVEVARSVTHPLTWFSQHLTIERPEAQRSEATAQGSRPARKCQGWDLNPVTFTP